MKKPICFLIRQHANHTNIYLKLYRNEFILKRFTSHPYALRWVKVLVNKIIETSGKVKVIVEKDMFYNEKQGESSNGSIKTVSK